MHFSTALHRGRLIKRYKRFLADVELESGEIVTAHCANTGSMSTCYEPSSLVWLSRNDDPARKLKWTWEYSETPSGLIGINTHRPNIVVAEAIRTEKITTLCGYASLRLEVKYGANSRIDILLEDSTKPSCYVEVKNTTLLIGETVMFPDAVTSRGLKHLEELHNIVKAGHRAVMVFFINRPDGSIFAPADKIDSKYGEALRRVARAGVEVLAIRAVATPREISVGETIPVKL